MRPAIRSNSIIYNNCLSPFDFDRDKKETYSKNEKEQIESITSLVKKILQKEFLCFFFVSCKSNNSKALFKKTYSTEVDEAINECTKQKYCDYIRRF
jgi:hypothetical protein